MCSKDRTASGSHKGGGIDWREGKLSGDLCVGL